MNMNIMKMTKTLLTVLLLLCHAAASIGTGFYPVAQAAEGTLRPAAFLNHQHADQQTFSEPVLNNPLHNMMMQRASGSNIFTAIVSIPAILPSYNADPDNREKYSQELAEGSYDIQLKLMRWLSGETDMPIIYGFMRLCIEGIGVARANGKTNKITREVKSAIGKEEKLRQVFKIGLEGYSDDPDSMDLPEGGMDKLKIPDPEIIPEMKSYINFIRDAKQDSELSNKAVMAFVIGPISLTGSILGEENAAMLAMDNPGLYQKWIDYSTKVIKTYIEKLIGSGANVICILEPSIKTVSPSIVEKHGVASTNDIIELIHSMRAMSIEHMCGDTGAFFAQMVKMNAHGFSLDKEVDLLQFSKLRPDAVMVGNADNMTIGDKPPNAIEEEARAVIEKCRELDREGKLLPCTGCEVKSLGENKQNGKTGIDQLRALGRGFKPGSIDMPASEALAAPGSTGTDDIEKTFRLKNSSGGISFAADEPSGRERKKPHTLITLTPPAGLSQDEKLMWDVAYIVALFFTRRTTERSPEEFFGLCYGVLLEEYKGKQLDDKRLMVTRLKMRIIDRLRSEGYFTGISRKSVSRIESAISRISGNASVAAIAREADVSTFTVARYIKQKIKNQFAGKSQGPDGETESIDRIKGLSQFAREAATIPILERLELWSKVNLLLELKETERTALFFREIEGRKQNEIAFIMGYEDANIGYILKNATKQLSILAKNAGTIDQEETREVITHIREEVYGKYRERLRIAGFGEGIEANNSAKEARVSAHDFTAAESFDEIEPTSPAEDLALFNKALESFPASAELEKTIALKGFLHEANHARIAKECKISGTKCFRKNAHALIYLHYYIKGRGLIGYIIRHMRSSDSRTMLSLPEILVKCYKSKIAVVSKKSFKVHDDLRGATIDLARLNNFDNYRDLPDGHVHLARDIELAKKAGILRIGLGLLNINTGGRMKLNLIRNLANKNNLDNQFKSMRISATKYFSILKMLRDKKARYEGSSGLDNLYDDTIILPGFIYALALPEIRREMGWNSRKNIVTDKIAAAA